MKIKFLITRGFVKHFKIKMSVIKSERRFDDSMSSLSSSKYMVKCTMYFELDNDVMESSKRRSLFISLIFILKLTLKVLLYLSFTLGS